MIKKIIIFFFALTVSVALVLAFSSCSGTENPSDTSTDTGSQGTTPNPDDSQSNEGSTPDDGNGESPNPDDNQGEEIPNPDDGQGGQEPNPDDNQGGEEIPNPDDNQGDEQGGATPHTHSYGEWVTTKEPTCNEAGEKKQTCSCGDYKTEPIEATGHSEEIVEAVEPNCTETGLTEGKKCSVCGVTTVEQETISAKGHSEETIIGKEATCTETGLTDGKICTVCQTVTVEQTIIPLKDHTYANKVCQICKELEPSQGLAYTLNKETNTYTVTGIDTCTDTEIVIPSKYEGLPVTSIGYKAFRGCTSLTSITITEGVTSIGVYAFYGCTSLTSITIPNSVTSIGNSAFQICTSLTSVTIGDSVTSIGSHAFKYCTSLTSVTIGDSVKSIGYEAFRDCTSLVEINFNATAMKDLSQNNGVFSNAGKDGDGIKVTIGKNVTKIPAYLFYLSSTYSLEIEITSVEFEEGSVCESIGDYAFYYCTSLESVTIPNGVTSIGDYAFDRCYKLVEVYNLSSLNIAKGSSSNGYIGYYAKVIHTSLEEETILHITQDGHIFAVVSDNEIYLIDYVGKDAELILPESYNGNNYEIYQYAFDGCTLISNITIPEGVISIGSYAFSGCTSLTSVTIGNSVTSIGSYAFNYCYKLVEVYNLSSLNVSSNYAKVIHTSLEEKSILETVNDYILMTWEGKYYLIGYVGNDKELTLPESYNGNNYEIYKYAFYERDDITKVIIPDSVTSIGIYAFEYCTSLTSVTIGDSVTSIGYSVFSGCTSLTSVTIGDSVTSIGDFAFYNCSSLKQLHISDIASWCNISFDDYDSNPLYHANNLYINGKLVTELVIPDTVTEIKPYAFYNCTSLTSVTIPNNVISIGDDAFYYCTSLKEVHISDIASWCNISFGNYYSNPLYYAKNLYINNELVTNLVIPDTVTKINAYAFYNCTSLTSI